MKNIFEFVFILFLLTLLAGCATPLHTASGDGNTKTVVELLDKGKYDINERAYDCHTPLHYAALYGHIDTVRLLLERGADIHAKCRGWDSLAYAASQGHADVAQLLIDRGIDIDNTIESLERDRRSAGEINNATAGIKLLERLAKKQQKPAKALVSPQTLPTALPTALPLPTEPAAPF